MELAFELRYQCCSRCETYSILFGMELGKIEVDCNHAVWHVLAGSVIYAGGRSDTEYAGSQSVLCCGA